jgi:uncharacterized protein (TIGR00269 family)
MESSCSKCNEPAVYFRRYTAEMLCRGCLVNTSLDRVRRTINRNQMFRDNDRIAVAISGGKDSAVLFDVLYRIEAAYPQAEILPFTIDEGISGYRDKALEAAKRLVKSLGMQLEVRTFREYFGYTLDEIVSQRSDSSFGACSYCGVLRRRAMNDAASELGADVVATGHILDDESQTVIMNIMRGDSTRLARNNRARDQTISGFVPRVKPIMELTERDIVAYTHNLDLPYHDVPCPYAAEAYRNDIRSFLNEMEFKRPGTLLAILRSAETISKALQDTRDSAPIMKCEKCGSPSSTRICKTCSLLEELQG